MKISKRTSISTGISLLILILLLMFQFSFAEEMPLNKGANNTVNESTSIDPIPTICLNEGYDTDKDGISDVCDTCPNEYNPEQDENCNQLVEKDETSKEFKLLNGGKPIDFEGDFSILKYWGDVDTITNEQGDLVYTYQTSAHNNILGRYNQQEKHWEVNSFEGWTNSDDAIPRPINYGMMFFDKINMFYQNEELNIIAKQVVKSGENLLDVHGDTVHLVLSDNEWKLWNLDKDFSRNLFKAIFFARNAAEPSFYFDTESNEGILVDIFGRNRMASLVAAKYISDDAEYKWHRWNNDRWIPYKGGKGESDCGAELCSFVPNDQAFINSNIVKEQDYITNPQITKIKGTTLYLITSAYAPPSESSSKITETAFLYDDSSEKWEWWNGNKWKAGNPKSKSWTSEMAYPFGAFAKTSFNKIFSTEENTVDAFYKEDNYIKMFSYNHSEKSRRTQTIAQGQIENFIVNQDSNNDYWLAYTEKNQIRLLKREAGAWTDYGFIYSADSKVMAKEVSFVESETPVVFFSQILNGKERVFAASDIFSSYWINENVRENKINHQSILLNENFISLDNEWTDGEGFRMPKLTSGHMAIDSDGYIYSPEVRTNKVTSFLSTDLSVLHEWGGDKFNWKVFKHPGGVDVHNAKAKIYIADRLTGSGGLGPIEAGQIQVWDIAKRDEDFKYAPAYDDLTKTFNWPADVAVDETNDYLYVSEPAMDRVVRFNILNDGTINKTSSQTIGSYGSGDLEFNFPQALDSDQDGNLYIVDARNHRIQKISFDVDGTPHMAAEVGVLGNSDSQFIMPYGISVNQDNVFVTDPFAKTVQIFDKDLNYCYGWNKFLVGGEEHELDKLAGVLATNDSIYLSIVEAYGSIYKFDILSIPECGADSGQQNVQQQNTGGNNPDSSGDRSSRGSSSRNSNHNSNSDYENSNYINENRDFESLKPAQSGTKDILILSGAQENKNDGINPINVLKYSRPVFIAAFILIIAISYTSFIIARKRR